jgi:predicted amidohydrolase
MKNDHISRRKFLRNTAVTTGIASVSPLGVMTAASSGYPAENPGHEIWIAGVCQLGLEAVSSELMIEEIYGLLGEVIVYKPDFVCLPEAFPFQNVRQTLTMQQKVAVSEKALEKLTGFSKQNNCYSICPVYTSEEGAVYNSAVVFDRKGNRIGKYNKIHPTEGEIKDGISPGALFQPVIQTDAGPIGVQICFDINWIDGWNMLEKQGARIIFWPSAYGGGKTVNTKAWQNRCIVASSTHKGTSKLCDITGETVTQTGQWNRNLFCGPVNMEKVFLATWPYVNRFKEIQNKYGRKIRITTFHEEEWSIIESLSPDVLVKDILKEFELKTYEEHIVSAEQIQNRTRK